MTRLDRLEKLLVEKADAQAAMPEWRYDVSNAEHAAWSMASGRLELANLNLDEALRTSAVSLLAVARAASRLATDVAENWGCSPDDTDQPEPLRSTLTALEPLLREEAGDGA